MTVKILLHVFIFSLGVLQIRANLMFMVQPFNQTVCMGTNITLTCNVTGTWLNSITWIKDGFQVSTTAVERNLSVLHLRNIQKQDEGLYFCAANISNNYMKSNEENITVFKCNESATEPPTSQQGTQVVNTGPVGSIISSTTGSSERLSTTQSPGGGNNGGINTTQSSGESTTSVSGATQSSGGSNNSVSETTQSSGESTTSVSGATQSSGGSNNSVSGTTQSSGGSNNQDASTIQSTGDGNNEDSRSTPNAGGSSNGPTITTQISGEATDDKHVNVTVTVKTVGQYTDKLNDKSSDSYQTFKKNYENTFQTAINNEIGGVVSVTVLAVKKGSIIVVMAIIIDPKTSNLPKNITVGNAVKDAIIKANQTNKLGSINMIDFLDLSTQYVDKPTEKLDNKSPTEDDGLKGWQIALIVIIALILIGISVFIGFLIFYKKNTADTAKEIDEYDEIANAATNTSMYENMEDNSIGMSEYCEPPAPIEVVYDNIQEDGV